MEERRFRAMGTDAHVIVVGGPTGLADRAAARIDELEHRWSRFIPDSEVSRLNASAGTPVAVSDDTIELITRAIDAWHLTGATFDPTVLGDVLRAGYTTSFDALPSSPTAGVSDLVIACTDITIDGNVVSLPSRSGFDPGGIGKGLAADLTATMVVEAGADGVCINVGGDLRVIGTGPEGDGWTIAVEHPWFERPITTIGLGDGAVATSTTLRRRWTVDGDDRHHVIDPRTGEPAVTDLNHVTVVAASAWVAEVVAKAVLIRGSAHPFDLVDASDAHALLVDDDGRVTVSEGFHAFAGALW